MGEITKSQESENNYYTARDLLCLIELGSLLENGSEIPDEAEILFVMPKLVCYTQAGHGLGNQHTPLVLCHCQHTPQRCLSLPRGQANPGVAHTLADASDCSK